MGQSVARTINLAGSFVSALGVVLIVVGALLPICSIYHRSHSETTVEDDAIAGSEAALLRPAMIQLPPMNDGHAIVVTESVITLGHYVRVMRRTPSTVAHLRATRFRSENPALQRISAADVGGMDLRGPAEQSGWRFRSLRHFVLCEIAYWSRGGKVG